MKKGITQTLELAKENGVTLDFSDGSIQEIEKLLAECHLEYKKQKSEEGFHTKQARRGVSAPTLAKSSG